MVFGMIGKYIRILKFKQNPDSGQIITLDEFMFISRIRIILMTRASIPDTFAHVGPDNSDEEDQFYKYRAELIDIFKNILDIPGSKEASLNEIIDYIARLPENPKPEIIELPLFLLFHFAEKVNDLGELLKSENDYSKLIGTIASYPFPGHKIVVRMYFENIVRYSSYFNSPERMKLFVYPLNQFLLHIKSQDKDIKKHSIYMLYRLAIKNCLCLVEYVEPVLNTIIQVLSSPTEQENTIFLYKTIGLIIGNKQMSTSLQIPLFSNICDMISQSLSRDSLFVFTEILSGFNKKISPELAPKLKQTTEIILKNSMQNEKNNDTIKFMCLLVQKLIDTLEEESALYVTTCMEYLIGVINMETIESFFNVVSNCCNKIKQGLDKFIPVDKMRELIMQIINNVPAPNETVTDFAQQSISVRRSLVKVLDALLVFFPILFDFPKITDLITYIGIMSSNFIESSTPKLSLILLGKFIEIIAIKDPSNPIAIHILATAYQVSQQILNEKKVANVTPDISQVVGELVNLHKTMLGFACKLGKEAEFYQSLSTLIKDPNLEVYQNSLKIILTGDQKASHEKSVHLKNIILGIISPKNN